MMIEISEHQATEYNRLYKRAMRLVRRHLLIDGEPQSGRPGWFARRRLRRGIVDFQQALALAPFKWECRFWIGKACQRLGHHEESMTWFMEALRQEPQNPTIAKEAANAAFELGQFETGAGILKPAIVQKPTDPVLHYDLAIHLLLSGRPKEAYESLQRAASLEASSNTSRMMNFVEKVLSGQVLCPKSAPELRHGA